MVFSSITFLFYFLPIVLITYYLTPKNYRNIILLIASFLFYFFGEPKYVFLMLFLILIAYIFALLIDDKKEHKKLYLTTALIINILFLGYFKYFNFIIENINAIFKSNLDFVEVILPIGISFYTFQIISYLIDVYRGKVRAQKSFIKLATYVALFPQLIAGPIVRYKDINESLENREYSIDKFALGIRIFILGLGKKVILANTIGELVNIFSNTSEPSVLFYWLYVIANMLQIYFDFSGYSDMTIGLGHMFGFEFMKNFNYPYIATSITDFWRRWHISLSSWFKDYVYIPLGGSRVKKVKALRNILIVWLLTGLWHGAAWNFIIWGLYFGILLILEKEIVFKHLKKIPTSIRYIFTITLVSIGFVIFSSNNLTEIVEILKGLVGINTTLTSLESIYYFKSYFILLLLGIVASTPLPSKLVTNKKITKIINILEPIYLLIIFVISVSYIVDGSFNPFLYFRF